MGDIDAIRTAILEGAPGEELGALPVPRSVRGAVVRGRRADDVRRAWPPRTRTRASRCTSSEFPLPELAPDEAYVGGDGLVDQLQHGVDVDLRAAADVRVPQAARQGERVGRAPRPAVPRAWAATRRAWCCASGPRCATGSRATAVTVHCNYVDDQDPSAHDDSMMATNQRIWGFESNFGGLAEIAVVKANQLMPKPAHLTWEEAAVQRAVQLHELPHDRQPERRADDAGSVGADLGRDRRHRRVRRASTC